MGALMDKAIHFAFKKHEGQLDDEGKEYIYHPFAVADIIKIIAPTDENLIAAAYLHDTLEDTDTTIAELAFEFGQDVADLVNEVTHDGDKDKGYYFPRLKTQRGIMLKFADRLHNLSRMQPWNESRIQHYLRKSRFWKNVQDEMLIDQRKK